MSTSIQFRSAINGFHRLDVVDYIESQALQHSRRVQELNGQLERLQAELEHLRTVQPAKIDAAPPEKEPVLENLEKLELESYRRAVATERLARHKAQQLCQQVNQTLDDTISQWADAHSEIYAVLATLNEDVQKLSGCFTQLNTQFDQNQSTFSAIQKVNSFLDDETSGAD